MRILKKLFNHRHKWQTRATNAYFIPTYRVCKRCGESQEWKGGEDGKFQKCDPMPEFDNQFDNKGNFIFK
jgi:hypothetical protein